jgi:type VII secretion integral membrane protein EccD
MNGAAMTSAQPAELCRITVFGPSGRADLAVPASTTVASLMPMLVLHTVDEAELVQDPEMAESMRDGSWVLQRLGEAPLDLDGTPETLDWLEGEQLYLRPADNPMPELDFDDIADGMATAIGRQNDRWRPVFSRYMFLSLAVATVATIIAVLFKSASGLASTITSGVLALFFATASVCAGRWLRDRELTVLPGLAACAFAAVAGLIGVAGMEGALALQPMAVVIGSLAATFTASLLLGLRFAVSPRIPIVPFGTVVVCGVAAMVAMWLHLGGEYPSHETAALISGAFFAMMIFAPKIAIRIARLRGPQLPRTADELQVDIEPSPAAEVVERTGFADRYLNVLTMAGSFVFLACYPFLLDAPGWVGVALPIVFAVALLLRSRNFFGAWQRISVVVSGASGFVFIILAMVVKMPAEWHGVTILMLLLGIGVLVLAATRAPTRRLLPIWGHLANILETLTALAVVPLIMQVLGVYAWARGLAG